MYILSFVVRFDAMMDLQLSATKHVVIMVAMRGSISDVFCVFVMWFTSCFILSPLCTFFEGDAMSHFLFCLWTRDIAVAIRSIYIPLVHLLAVGGTIENVTVWTSFCFAFAVGLCWCIETVWHCRCDVHRRCVHSAICLYQIINFNIKSIHHVGSHGTRCQMLRL